jgi:hypothetical protein
MVDCFPRSNFNSRKGLYLGIKAGRPGPSFLRPAWKKTESDQAHEVLGSSLPYILTGFESTSTARPFALMSIDSASDILVITVISRWVSPGGPRNLPLLLSRQYRFSLHHLFKDDSTLAILGQSVGCICWCLHRTLVKTASETEITPLGIISSISEVSDVMWHFYVHMFTYDWLPYRVQSFTIIKLC